MTNLTSEHTVGKEEIEPSYRVSSDLRFKYQNSEFACKVNKFKIYCGKKM